MELVLTHTSPLNRVDYRVNEIAITWKRINISPSSYTILQQKVNLHTAGCGRLNTPSGVTVTPKRIKANTQATRPLKQQKHILFLTLPRLVSNV
jgi:hypothetical protein